MSTARPEPGALPRLATGVPRLDHILKGGLVRGGSYALLGPPGAGKTILANQIGFHHVRQEGKGLYVTLLSESIQAMLANLRTMTFFEEALVPSKLYYVSGFQPLESGGLAGLKGTIEQLLKDHRATFLVLDSVDALRDAAETEREYKKFLHELQAFARLMGCTTLLLSFRDSATCRGENTTVDGILELTHFFVGPRAVRELTIHKFRATDFLQGRHEVEITARGVQIHPRTEIQFDHPPAAAAEQRERVPFGVGRLDEMMGGGALTGSATALLGAPGTGKTMLGLTYLCEGAKAGQRGLYFGFYEPPPRLIEKAANIGLPLEEYVKQGLIEIIWQPPLEHFLDSLAEQLLEKLREDRDGGRRRLFIDGIEGFRAAAVYPDRVPRFLSAFFNQLRALDVTTVMSEELGLFEPGVRMPNPELANVVESVVLLRLVELRSQLHRLLSIMKMRESKFDSSIREFKILDGGIEVADSFATAEAILTGHARERAP